MNDGLSGSVITIGIYIVVALMGLTLLGVLFNILAGIFPTLIPTSFGRAMPEPLTNLWNRYYVRGESCSGSRLSTPPASWEGRC